MTYILLVVYIIGCVLAYGLYMGGVKADFSEILGVSRVDIRRSMIIGLFSWFGLLATYIANWAGGFTNAYCWQMKRSYPTSAQDYHKLKYIERHGEIKSRPAV